MVVQRAWVVAINDGEAVEILRLLRLHGETVYASRQPWGATWTGLEPDVVRAVSAWRRAHPDGAIYGVELAGPNDVGALNIDHHRYANEDRWKPVSSLEQVAEVLGVALSRREQLVALNDCGYIGAMLEAGATPEEVEDVRRQDRAAQGITPEDEREAEQDLARAEWVGERRVIVRCAQRGTSAHTDRLFGRADEILLASPGNWMCTGPRSRELAAMSWAERHWSGGDPASGYFGIEAPGAESRQRLKAWFRKDRV